MLVHFDRPQAAVRAHDVVDELLERVGLARERGRADAEDRCQRGDVARRQREGRLHDGSPLLEAVLVHGLELLHVHEAAAHLHRGVALEREQVDLVAFLHPVRLHGAEAFVCLAERLAERAPLPARHDPCETGASLCDWRLRCHRSSSPTSCAKYASALFVFVSCSPERSTPWPARKARVSIATSNASPVAQRVESSSTRDPSG